MTQMSKVVEYVSYWICCLYSLHCCLLCDNESLLIVSFSFLDTIESSCIGAWESFFHSVLSTLSSAMVASTLPKFGRDTSYNIIFIFRMLPCLLCLEGVGIALHSIGVHYYSTEYVHFLMPPVERVGMENRSSFGR